MSFIFVVFVCFIICNIARLIARPHGRMSPYRRRR